MTAPTRSILIVAALGLFSCHSEPGSCDREESFEVDLSGGCGGSAKRARLSVSACRVTLTGIDGPTGLPSAGSLSQKEDVLRQGGFLLYGDVCLGAEVKGCAAPVFRVCRVKRVEWWLDATCLEGLDEAPVCEARVNE